MEIKPYLLDFDCRIHMTEKSEAIIINKPRIGKVYYLNLINEKG